MNEQYIPVKNSYQSYNESAYSNTFCHLKNESCPCPPGQEFEEPLINDRKRLLSRRSLLGRRCED